MALERHGGQKGVSGSVCRFVMDLDGNLNKEQLQERLDTNVVLRDLLSLTIDRKGPLRKPTWKRVRNESPVLLYAHDSEELIPSHILDRGLYLEGGVPIVFDLVRRSSGSMSLIMSWHHILMDARGALLLLQHIGGLNGSQVDLSSSHNKIKYTAKLLGHTILLFLRYTGLFWAPFIHKLRSDIPSTKQPDRVHQKFNLIEFDEAQSNLIDQKACDYGATTGTSTFYLGCTAMAVKNMLENKGGVVRNLWVPVPQDERKKGASGPIIGNHLSFIFYSMKKGDFSSLTTLVNSLHTQLVKQVRSGLPKAYDVLMRGFRKLPTGLYYRLVKGSRGEALASFLFTISPTPIFQENTFMGVKIKRVLSLPPNTYPPGFTVSFLKYNKRLQISVLSYDEIESANEMVLFEKLLRQYLLGDETNLSALSYQS